MNQQIFSEPHIKKCPKDIFLIIIFHYIAYTYILKKLNSKFSIVLGFPPAPSNSFI